MNLLTADHITKSFGERYILKDASFYLHEGEKVGVLGINGTGKSTLLKIITGQMEPDDGTVITANHVVMRFLPQNPEFEEGKNILESILQDEAHDRTSESDALASKAKSMLNKLGLFDFSLDVNALSGGQKKCVALVKLLLKPCEILVLDEPTNHLDHNMANWLEDVLKNFRGAIVMVTHDRYFLDSVSNRIVEIDKGALYSYQTNYSGFLQLKAEREEMALASERKRQSILRKEIEWMQRGARARSTKQKAHIQRYETLRDMEGIAEKKNLELQSVSSRMGKTLLELHDVSFGYDDKKLIDNFSYIFLRDDRIGFVGSNGCGKTTLMKILAGIMEPQCGKVVVGTTIKIGYYTQEIAKDKSAGIAYMDPKKRVIDYIRDTAEYVKTKDGSISASMMLEKFLFPPQEQYAPIEKLSGGEKRRLNLLRVLMEAPNVLILDEPTNDLDVETLTILEDYLDDFAGIVITVSHDRYFLDRVVNRIFAFENGNIKQYEGNYTDYYNRVKDSLEDTMPQAGTNKSAQKEEKQDSRKTWGGEKKLKFTYMEQKEYDTIEDEIAGLEERLEEIEKQMGLEARNFVKLNELTKEKEEKENLLEEKMQRWMYLEDLHARIQEESAKR